MAIIKQHDKRSDITYVYESHSYWDPEKKMTRAKRKLIGKVDPDTGEIVPTDGRNKKSKTPASGDTDYKKMPPVRLDFSANSPCLFLTRVLLRPLTG